MKKSVVTIDGPAGAGKTTVSRMLADRLGYRYIDTGALYRAIALAVHEGGIDPKDDAALEKMCTALSLRYVQDEKGPRLLSSGRDVTDRLRTPEITMLASAVSARPVVRRFLMSVQRAMGRESGRVRRPRHGDGGLPRMPIALLISTRRKKSVPRGAFWNSGLKRI